MLRLSEAASLALHTMALLAGAPEKKVSAREIASALNASEAHLAKVLQRLARFGLVRSVRGPKGGFTLAKSSATISLLDIYESVEGPLEDKYCLRFPKGCSGDGCIFGHLLIDLSKHIRQYLSQTRLTDVAGVLGNFHQRPQR